MESRQRIQLQIPLPYKAEPKSDPQVGRLIEAGYTIAQLQRLTDGEALITLVRGGS